MAELKTVVDTREEFKEILKRARNEQWHRDVQHIRDTLEISDELARMLSVGFEIDGVAVEVTANWEDDACTRRTYAWVVECERGHQASWAFDRSTLTRLGDWMENHRHGDEGGG